MAEKTFWGIHSGRMGEADSLFLTEGVVGLGDSKLGDLSKIKPNRKDIKKVFSDIYPTSKPNAVLIRGGL